MPILAPLFREINFTRIHELKLNGLSDATIASIVNDETQNTLGVHAQDVASYLKLTAAGSSQMLVRKKTARAISEADRDGKLA